MATVVDLQASVDATLVRMRDEHWVARLWAHDATLWKDDEKSQEFIRSFVGWLRVPEKMRDHVEDLHELADEVKTEFDHIVLLGMGGSSLCPEVLRRSFGRDPGFPELIVLDSVLPVMVRGVESRIDPAKTLFLVSSKSGGTIEPNTLLAIFWEKVVATKGDAAGRNFIAITDEGTSLAKEAEAKGFRRTFINPSDIGGRYSALSFFGLVPAALMGLDVSALLDRADEAMNASGPANAPEHNPAAMLGAAMGTLAKAGRDKLTLVVSDSIAGLGLWIEQLVAESTGKEGRGILPVAGEPAVPVSQYSGDRFFVGMAMAGDESVDARLDEIEKAGHPTMAFTLHDGYDLASQFFVWEVATALAGAVIGINPFNQPNVQAAKDITGEVLDSMIRGDAREPDPSFDPAAFAAHVAKAGEGDYVALLAYVSENAEHDRLLAEIRERIIATRVVATTSGYGPRYLHSTGQLHKGGAATGLFVILTADEAEDVPVPGKNYTLEMLARAQPVGDVKALESRDRRVLRVHLGRDVAGNLARLRDAIA